MMCKCTDKQFNSLFYQCNCITWVLLPPIEEEEE